MLTSTDLTFPKRGAFEKERLAAAKDHRSIANLIEVLVREHCERVGITIPEQTELFDGK